MTKKKTMTAIEGITSLQGCGLERMQKLEAFASSLNDRLVSFGSRLSIHRSDLRQVDSLASRVEALEDVFSTAPAKLNDKSDRSKQVGESLELRVGALEGLAAEYFKARDEVKVSNTDADTQLTPSQSNTDFDTHTDTDTTPRRDGSDPVQLENVALKLKYEQVLAALSDASTRATNAEDAANHGLRTQEGLLAQLNAARQDYETTTGQLNEAKLDIQRKTMEFGQIEEYLQSQLKNAQQELVATARHFAELETENQHLRSCLNGTTQDGFLKQYQAVCNELQAVARELDEAKSAMQRKDTEIRHVKEQLSELSVAHQEPEMPSSRVSQLEMENRILRSRANDFEENNQDGMIAQLNAMSQGLETTSRELETTSRELGLARLDIRKKNTEFSQIEEHLVSQIKAARQEADVMQKRFAQLEAEYQSFRARVNDVEVKLPDDNRGFSLENTQIAGRKQLLTTNILRRPIKDAVGVTGVKLKAREGSGSYPVCQLKARAGSGSYTVSQERRLPENRITRTVGSPKLMHSPSSSTTFSKPGSGNIVVPSSTVLASTQLRS